MNVPSQWATGTIPSSGTLALAVGNGLPPFAVQLTSTNGSRAISVSLDGGNKFFPLTPTATIASAIYATVNYPVSQFLFAGAAGDTVEIL